MGIAELAQAHREVIATVRREGGEAGVAKYFDHEAAYQSVPAQHAEPLWREVFGEIRQRERVTLLAPMLATGVSSVPIEYAAGLTAERVNSALRRYRKGIEGARLIDAARAQGIEGPYAHKNGELVALS